MRVTSPADLAELIALRCEPARVSRVRELIAKAGIVLRGHFQLQSGVHTEYFFRARGLTANPDLLDDLARELLDAADARSDATSATAVLCPDSAGFLLGDAIARQLALPPVVTGTDLERRPSTELRVGRLVSGARVLLVNDVITSGTSMARLLRAARVHGATATRAFALAAIGPTPLKALNALGLSGYWLAECHWPLFAPDTCELCRRDVPLILSAELG